MRYGIYYAYWEKAWGGDFLPYVSRVKRLGFDILEVACGAMFQQPDGALRELGQEAALQGIELTGGYGPRPEHNLASADPAAVAAALDFYRVTFHKMQLAGIRSLGGALYSYWPVDYSRVPDKAGDWTRSVIGMQRLAALAEDYGVTLNMESLNRFEGYLINDAREALDYVEAVDRANVRVMLDTFHMNIEEDSIPEAIRLAGSHLGHFHVGEANRRPPRPGGRIPWAEVGSALRDIGYSGAVVMEPFVQMGGQVGADIKVWRDLSGGADAGLLDQWAADSVAYLKGQFEEK